MSKPGLHSIKAGETMRQQAAAWFARLRADDVSERDRLQWQAWLAQDPRHRQAYARLETLWSSLGDYAPLPEVGIHVRAAARGLDRPPRMRPLRWSALAALALVAVLLAALVLRSPTGATVSFATTVGERRSLQLSDGTRVDLDTSSALHVQYDQDERRIILDRGRAFFRVAHEQRPLRVLAESSSVRAVGTQFEVSRQTGVIDVALFEGRVELQSTKANGNPDVLLATLDPGQKARIAGNQISISRDPVQAGGLPDWLSGRLVFEDTPLSDAIREFNRYSTQPLLLQEPVLGKKRISGVFRSESPDGFLEALHEVYGIHSQRTSSGAYLLRENN